MLRKLRFTASSHGIVDAPPPPISRKDFSASPSSAFGSGYSASS